MAPIRGKGWNNCEIRSAAAGRRTTAQVPPLPQGLWDPDCKGMCELPKRSYSPVLLVHQLSFPIILGPFICRFYSMIGSNFTDRTVLDPSLNSMVSVFAFSAGLSRMKPLRGRLWRSLTNQLKMPVSHHGMQGRVWTRRLQSIRHFLSGCR